MEGKRLIRSIRLKNLLSFGSEGEEIELEPLNVLIGRNASGKSNLIDSIALLHKAPTNFANTIRQGGGISEWLWKGSEPNPIAEIEIATEHPKEKSPLRHKISFTRVGQRLEIVEESIEYEYFNAADSNTATQQVYRYQDGKVEFLPGQVISEKDIEFSSGIAMLTGRKGLPENLLSKLDESVLSKIKLPNQHPEIAYLAIMLEQIKIYKHWDTERNSSLRRPQSVDLPDDFLLEDASNLSLVLNDLHLKRANKKIVNNLKEFYNEVEDYSTKIQGGTVQIFIHEEGLSQPIPATRLSDGTLRYLCLLTILCHPSPPPLVCIEEPELGLHPDVLHTVAKLLIEASQRTQLIVTTHSDILVDALSETPEAILVCERDADGTHFRRLERDILKEWLEKYSLGELWRMGEIGAV